MRIFEWELQIAENKLKRLAHTISARARARLLNSAVWTQIGLLTAQHPCKLNFQTCLLAQPDESEKGGHEGTIH